MLPEVAGIATNNYARIRIQIHFDNPKMLRDLKDDSGVRFYVSKKGATRQHEFGVLQLGDPSVRMGGKMLPGGLSHYQFECAGKPKALT